MFQSKQLSDTQTFLVKHTEGVLWSVPKKVHDVPRCTFKMFASLKANSTFFRSQDQPVFSWTQGQTFHSLCMGWRWGSRRVRTLSLPNQLFYFVPPCSYKGGIACAVCLSYRPLHATHFTNGNLFLISLPLIDRRPDEDTMIFEAPADSHL